MAEKSGAPSDTPDFRKDVRVNRSRSRSSARHSESLCRWARCSRKPVRRRRECRPWRSRRGSGRTLQCLPLSRTRDVLGGVVIEAGAEHRAHGAAFAWRRERKPLPDQHRVDGGIADALLRNHAAMHAGPSLPRNNRRRSPRRSARAPSASADSRCRSDSASVDRFGIPVRGSNST